MFGIIFSLKNNQEAFEINLSDQLQRTYHSCALLKFPKEENKIFKS